MSQQPTPAAPPPLSLAILERSWARGLLSSDELLGCLIRHLVRQEQNSKNQEPRTKNRSHEEHKETAEHEQAEESQLKTQTSELNTPAGEQLNTQNSALKTRVVLETLLRQIGDALDGLTGQQLDLWRAGGLWYWRWEDTGQLSPRGLGSHGEALVDAVEQRSGLVCGDEPPGEAGLAG